MNPTVDAVALLCTVSSILLILLVIRICLFVRRSKDANHTDDDDDNDNDDTSNWLTRNALYVSSSLSRTPSDTVYIPITFGSAVVLITSTADLVTDLVYAVITDFANKWLLIACWVFISLQAIPQIVVGIMAIVMLLDEHQLVVVYIAKWYWKEVISATFDRIKEALTSFIIKDLVRALLWFMVFVVCCLVLLLLSVPLVIWVMVIAPLWTALVIIVHLLASITKLLAIESVQTLIPKLLVRKVEDDSNDGVGEPQNPGQLPTEDEGGTGWKHKIKIKRGVFNGLVLIEIVLESFPQIVISLTNTLMGGEGFDEVTIATLSVSTFVLMNIIWKIGYNVCYENRSDIKEWEI